MAKIQILILILNIGLFSCESIKKYSDYNETDFLKLADIYDYNADKLLVLFLSDKILYEIQDEDLGIEALRVAEERVKYLKNVGKKHKKTDTFLKR
ncbi:MAG TPA: hypothetical protein VF985_04675, partial [Mariniflexile sp.]